MLNVMDIIKATGGKAFFKTESVFSGVSIDSRTIKEGELFIALKGDRFDGHDFVNDSLKVGSGAIVDSKFNNQNLKFKDKTVILVDDTLTALHHLARYMRKGFSGTVIGVVGSNGKTTTKELISSILSTKLHVLKTAGNLNNHIGMPLSITRIEKDTDVMVLEMGTNRTGDVDKLCSIANPDIGVITNIGYEHLEGFGSLDKVRDSELEILPYLKKVILNADDLFLKEGVIQKFKGEIISFGIKSANADVTAKDIVFSDRVAKFFLCMDKDSILIESRLPGRFNIYNSLAAASTARAMGFNHHEIKKGLESFEGVEMRFEIKQYEGIMFLNDVYNANPSSMEESIKELIRRIQTDTGGNSGNKRAIAVLGDMLELGEYSITAHKNLGKWMSGLPVNFFIGVGSLMASAVSEFKGSGICKDTPEDAARELGKMVREGDIVLIKGSRGMKMEKVLQVMGKEIFKKQSVLSGQRGE
ncbi:MAG: UDP-N-acetylmuramoyl-tripeptide--D-alanyl-D-alanine ligase [Thermodesulfovibrio sp.]|nr:UDP-N-acetylmuramoyl-tripeptide--D-alanyl-D-alanine ligase [Thermodesulfovibrio sp.]